MLVRNRWFTLYIGPSMMWDQPFHVFLGAGPHPKPAFPGMMQDFSIEVEIRAGSYCLDGLRRYLPYPVFMCGPWHADRCSWWTGRPWRILGWRWPVSLRARLMPYPITYQGAT